jgi:hypothetical protein
MATVLESVLPKNSVLLCAFFLWAKGLNAKGINKEMFPVYGGKCLLRKEVHNWVEKHGKRFADGEDVETEVRKWLRHHLCRGFRRTGKAMGQAYQCWWRICREINVFFQIRMSHVLRFISICGLFYDSLVWRKWTKKMRWISLNFNANSHYQISTGLAEHFQVHNMGANVGTLSP